MKAEIIQIGNSRGIRIPKPILEQCGMTGAVTMQVEGNQLIVTPLQAPRSGWSEAFATMADAGDDAPLLNDDANEWDAEEWQW